MGASLLALAKSIYYGIYQFDGKVTAPIKRKMKDFPCADSGESEISLSEERIINYKPVGLWKNCKNIYIHFFCVI